MPGEATWPLRTSLTVETEMPVNCETSFSVRPSRRRRMSYLSPNILFIRSGSSSFPERTAFAQSRKTTPKAESPENPGVFWVTTTYVTTSVYSESTTPDSTSLLINKYLSIVVALASTFVRRGLYRDHDELESVGRLALVECAPRIDLERTEEERLAYVKCRVRGAMIEEIGREFRQSSHAEVTENLRCEFVSPDDVLAVRAALSDLSPRQQQVIRYRYYEGRTQAETATVLRISGSRVHELEHRGIEQLQGALRAAA
jgi:RNA polymerase sigma factor (sigma-70 family)